MIKSPFIINSVFIIKGHLLSIYLKQKAFFFLNLGFVGNSPASKILKSSNAYFFVFSEVCPHFQCLLILRFDALYAIVFVTTFPYFKANNNILFIFSCDKDRFVIVRHLVTVIFQIISNGRIIYS